MIKIIRSELFKRYPELVFGFSTKAGGFSPEPYCLNLSISVSDDPENVKKNRRLLFDELGIEQEEITFQNQIHSTIINYSESPQFFNEGCDAIYSDRQNNFLAISVADCIPVFLFDPEKKIVAGIHSGWKGTHGKILTKTINEITEKFDVKPEDILAYIGPGISQENYEVGTEVGELFDDDVKIKKGDKYFLDLKKDNYKQLISCGVSPINIEVSDLCTFKEKDQLHSYRRDGIKSGRMFGIIGIRKNY